MRGEALSLFDWRPTDSAEGVRSDSPWTSRPAEAAESRALSHPDPDGLRPYQRTAFGRVFESLAVGLSTLIVLATGLGKTVIFAAIAKHWRGRVLVLAHRSELLEQARRKLEQLTGEPVGLEQANYWAGQQRIVVGSVQTLGTAKDYRRRRFEGNPFTLVIVDEAHHAVAKTYRAVLGTFPNAKVLGVTATPDRGDEVALKKVFGSVAYVRDYLEGLADGYLVPVTALTIELGQVDLRKVESKGGDLALGQLDREMQKGNERIVAKTTELAGDRKTIVFVPGVEGAHLLAATFNRDVRRAVVVDGKTPKDQRADLLKAHSRGDVQFLVNVGIATEGYDCPEVSCVAIARPTKSRSLYAQMAGRGGRVLPGLVEFIEDAETRRAKVAASGKPDLLLLDFVGQAGRHKLVSPVDILGGRDVDDETLARARRILRKKPARPDEAVAQAKDQLRREREAREARVRGLTATVRADARRVDPFGQDGRPDFDEHGRPFWSPPEPVKDLPFLKRGKPMSRGLFFALKSKGYTEHALGGLDHDGGVRLLRREKMREAQGLANHRTIAELARYGVAAREMRHEKALEVLREIGRNRGRPLEPARLDAILRAPRIVGAEG